MWTHKDLAAKQRICDVKFVALEKSWKWSENIRHQLRGHSVLEPRNVRANERVAKAGRLRLLTTERAVASALRHSTDREARRAIAVEFRWSSVIAFGFVACTQEYSLHSHIRLYSFVKNPQDWFAIRYTLYSLNLGHGPASVGNSIPTFRRNVVASSSVEEISGSDHPVTQAVTSQNRRLHHCAHLKICMLLIPTVISLLVPNYCFSHMLHFQFRTCIIYDRINRPPVFHWLTL